MQAVRSPQRRNKEMNGIIIQTTPNPRRSMPFINGKQASCCGQGANSRVLSFAQKNAVDLQQRGYSSLTLAMTVGGKHTDPVKNMTITA